MLNRIRRAFSLTRARNSTRGRHRRPPAPSCTPPITPASHTSVAASIFVASLTPADAAPHRTPLRGEDVALVRPYVLAPEKKIGARPMVIAPHLPADAWSVLTGAR
ncbi:hypothetical protein B9W62_25285 [Streptomyces sp. CS113]|nr:hypothetical protein B9W62_25285 [Streptomyces sp. CS113]